MKIIANKVGSIKLTICSFLSLCQGKIIVMTFKP